MQSMPKCNLANYSKTANTAGTFEIQNTEFAR